VFLGLAALPSLQLLFQTEKKQLLEHLFKRSRDCQYDIAYVCIFNSMKASKKRANTLLK